MDEDTRFTDEELSPAERARFQAVRRDADLPPSLEERVVGSLRSNGLLVSGRVTRRPAWLVGAIAAGLMLFVAGVAVGRSLGPQGIPATEAVIQVPKDSGAATESETASQTASVEVWF